MRVRKFLRFPSNLDHLNNRSFRKGLMKENELREKPWVVRNTLGFKTKMTGLLSRWTRGRLVHTDLCHDDIQKDTEEPRHGHKNGKNNPQTDMKDEGSLCTKGFVSTRPLKGASTEQNHSKWLWCHSTS